MVKNPSTIFFTASSTSNWIVLHTAFSGDRGQEFSQCPLTIQWTQHTCHTMVVHKPLISQCTSLGRGHPVINIAQPEISLPFAFFSFSGSDLHAIF